MMEMIDKRRRGMSMSPKRIRYSTPSRRSERSATPSRRSDTPSRRSERQSSTPSRRRLGGKEYSNHHQHNHRSSSTTTRNSSTRSSGRASLGGPGGSWNVGLNVEKLENCLCQAIPEILQSPNLDTDKFQGLADMCKTKSDVSRAALEEASDWMSSFLSRPSALSPRSSRTMIDLPPELTAELHSYIGLIREIQGDTNAAIRSYTKALWILNRARLSWEHGENLDDDEHAFLLNQQMALALYRLGAAYGRFGDYVKMQDLLNKAESLQQEEHLTYSISAAGM